MLAPPSHISTRKISSAALKGQLARGSTTLQMLCRTSEHAKVALLIFALAMPHTGKGTSLIKALGQWFRGEWPLVGMKGRSCKLRGMSPVHQVFTYPANGNLNTAPGIPLAPTSTQPRACGSNKTVQKLRPQETSDGFEAEATEMACF